MADYFSSIEKGQTDKQEKIQQTERLTVTVVSTSERTIISKLSITLQCMVSTKRSHILKQTFHWTPDTKGLKTFL